MALHPNLIGDIDGDKMCYITDARKCTTCACDYYVRYSEDGGVTWLGLDWNGNAGTGGTGCPGYGQTLATQTDALNWLKDKHIDEGRCGCKPNVSPCADWQNAGDEDLYAMALHPNLIRDIDGNKMCYIADARKCTTCACDYYVRYSEDGGVTWLGLDWNGNAGTGGTGCPGYGQTSATQTDALNWLRDKHIDEGRCGCKPKVSPCADWQNAGDEDLYAMALYPNMIGDIAADKMCHIW